MKRSSEYLQSNIQPRDLTSEQIKDPSLVLAEFFDAASLPQMRDRLWIWLEATVTGSFCKELTRIERSNIMLMYKQVKMLVEAAHIIHVKKKRSGKSS